MRPVFLALMVWCAVTASPLRAQESPERAAQAAAEAWLAIVDAAEYGESWERAARAFRDAVTKPGWDSAMVGARQPLGDMQSRELLGAQYTTELPGAPPGEYVLLQFRTTFANRPTAVETVVPMKDPDGTWRVSGYFIR